MELINSFKKYLINATGKMVVKDGQTASQEETYLSRRNGEIYTSCCLELDTFWSHDQYSPYALYYGGVTNSAKEAMEWFEDKHLIPEEKQKLALQAQRWWIKETYIEANAYYRLITGQRPIGEDPIMIPKQDLVRYGYVAKKSHVELDSLPKEILKLMETSGDLERLKKQYPNAKYLDYMGERQVDLVVARHSEDFQLLYFPKQDNAFRFYKDFVHIYEDARIYYMTVIFNYSFADMYEEYHGFIGFMIMMTAIERMLSGVFKVVADRNFYDLESIRVFLSEFNIPYVKLFSLNQQQLLVKNMNILLRQKGNMNVLFETLSLLGYHNFDLYKYILVKQHIMKKENDESQPVPVFYYRTVCREDGSVELVPDTESMYEYYFYAVPMRELDVVVGSPLDDNAYTYSQVTADDATWIEDSELSAAKANMKMNYTETKYAMLTMTYHVQDVSSEITYLTRLILDKKPQTAAIKVEMSVLFGGECNLFDIWCVLICLICKRNQLSPDIVDTNEVDLVVWGWNFNADFSAIREEIIAKPNLFDQDLLKHIYPFGIGGVSDVDDAIRHIKEVKRILTSTCLRTSDPVVYHANEKLYNSIMLQTLDNNSILQLTNGNLASTYEQYLRNHNPDVLEFYDAIEDPDECIDYINYIGTKMSTLFPSTEYLSYLNPLDTTLLEAILTILRTFKSLTVDIKDSNTVYRFDDRFTNMMKMMDSATAECHLTASEKGVYYNDNIHLFSSAVEMRDRLRIVDGGFIQSTMAGHDVMILRDDRFWIFGYVKEKVSDRLDVGDVIHQTKTSIATSSRMNFRDGFKIWDEDTLPDSIRKRLIRRTVKNET